VCQREAEVVALRLRGAGWREIAEAVGISIRGASQAWTRALKLVVLPDATEAKKELLEKCRALETNLWAAFNRATAPGEQAAVAAQSCDAKKDRRACWVPTCRISSPCSGR